MLDLINWTQSSWEEAARGSKSLVIATFVTHSALAAFEEIENRMKLFCAVSNPGVLQSRFVELQQGMNLQTTKKEDPEFPLKQMIDCLQENWLALDRMKAEGIRPLSGQRPSYFTLRQGPESDSQDKEYVRSILRDIQIHVHSGILQNIIVRMGSPIYDEVGFYATCGESDENSLRCCFGLQLLLQSCRSYYFARPTPAMLATCRLQALKFAQQAIDSIESTLDSPTMPCRCPGTLACHLDRLKSDFQYFMKAKIFDLYSQAPWVSGSHIIEMLNALFHHGLRLFNYRTYICSILHVYNVLNQLTGLQPIFLFEKLVAGAMGEVVFPGGRPRLNYTACYTRSIGGRLRFGSHKSRRHSLAVPLRAAKATAGFSVSRCEADTDHRFKIEKISLLHCIKNQRYHPTSSQLQRIIEFDNNKARESYGSKAAKWEARDDCRRNMQDGDISSINMKSLQNLEDIVGSELAGTYPVAALNSFAIYRVCVDIICIISDKYHTSMDTNMMAGQHCLCFVDDILSAGDRCRRDEKTPFGNKQLVNICKETIVERLADKDFETFLWKYL